MQLTPQLHMPNMIEAVAKNGITISSTDKMHRRTHGGHGMTSRYGVVERRPYGARTKEHKAHHLKIVAEV